MNATTMSIVKKITIIAIVSISSLFILSIHNKALTTCPEMRSYAVQKIEKKESGMKETYSRHTSTILTVREKKPIRILKETFNPNSAYYGNLHKNTYGWPLAYFNKKSFKREKRDWNQYLPWLEGSIKKYKLKNPTNDDTYFTARSSVVTVESKKLYKVGNVLVATIQAKDKRRRNKSFGGDRFRARLVQRDSNNKIVDGIACKIQDNLDGTYTIKAPLLMPGVFTLEVFLALSVEGISYFIDFTNMRDHHGNYYNTTLKSNETVECNLDLDLFDAYKGRPLCDYANPRNKEPWYCSVPPSKKCPPIVSIIFKHMSDKFPYDIRVQVAKKFGRAPEISGSGEKVTIMSQESDTTTIRLNRPSLLRFFWPFGYLRERKWTSLLREYNIDSTRSSRKCFQNKVVYFFGDSTDRQIFTLAVNKFKLIRSGPDNTKIWQQPQVGQSEDPADNITMYYRAHGPPLRNPGPPDTRPYISDSIVGIRVGGPNVYVIFTIGLHLMYYDASHYVQRLKTIKDAIIEHQKVFPETRFIVKGLNIVLSPREWAIYRMDTILRSFFLDMKNVFYLDFADITTVLTVTNVHPPADILEEQCKVLFSYVCRWIN